MAQPLSETSPLMVVRLDNDLEMEEQLLEKQYRLDELDAVAEDSHVPLAKLWNEEARGLAALSLPITIATILEQLPPIVVSMMIGQVSGANSPRVLAGSSLSDFFQGQVTNCFATGLGAGVATLCSQSFGAKQYRQLWIYAQAGVLACIYCLVPIGIMCLSGGSLLRLVGQEAELARIAGVLIFIAYLAFPFFMVYTIARSALQAQNIATPFVVASAVSYGISLSLGYFLGNHTSLGYVGIALSNVVGQGLRALSVIPILLRNDLFRTSWPGWQWREAHGMVRRIWPIGAGSVLIVTFQSAGWNAIILLCGYLPNTATVMSANNIAATLLSLSFIPMIGISAGGMTRVGNALGAGQPRRASVAAAATAAEALAMSLVGVVTCACIAGPYVNSFTSDAQTVDLATRLIHYMLVLVPLVAGVFVAQGIFQACGAQILCAKLNFCFLCALGIALSVFFAIPVGRGVFGLWDGNMAGALGLSLATGVWLSRLDWRKTSHAARLYAHLHAEDQPEGETESSGSSFD